MPKPHKGKYIGRYFANTNDEVAKVVEEVIYSDPVKMIFITLSILDEEKELGRWKIEVHSGDFV